MPWEAHNIFVQPNDASRQALLEEPLFKKCIYHVTDLNDFEWYDPKFVHGLPPEGLLVVRLDNSDWCEDPIVWNELRDFPKYRLKIPISSIVEEDESAERFPPLNVSRYLMHLSNSTGAVVANYHGFSWGGPMENEYAFVYSPEETVYVGVECEPEIIRIYKPGDKELRREGDVLIESMKHFSLTLPTGYFALHTGQFNWPKYEINS